MLLGPRINLPNRLTALQSMLFPSSWTNLFNMRQPCLLLLLLICLTIMNVTSLRQTWKKCWVMSLCRFGLYFMSLFYFCFCFLPLTSHRCYGLSWGVSSPFSSIPPSVERYPGDILPFTFLSLSFILCFVLHIVDNVWFSWGVGYYPSGLVLVVFKILLFF